ncbi:Ig-like domain-containing protein [Parabacteroides goldsteinii]|uniref:Ig-like domain-containing protein n=1 Tax=Parabacteroides goldsteinii TaxID=328812 RepID=UPI00321B3384
MKWIISFTLCLSILFLTDCSKDNPDIKGEDPKPGTGETTPSIAIKTDSIVYNNKEHKFLVSLSNNPKIVSVDYYIDGELSKTIFESPYTYTVTLKNLNTGKHTINVIAKLQDGKLLKDEKNISFLVQKGDEYQGGIVIYVQDGMHGIISAKNDLEGGISGKYKYGYYREEYNSYSENDGFSNTQKFKGKADSNFAAIACLNYNGEGYNDWYLPSLKEFEYLKDFEDTLIQYRLNNIYWTSTLREDDMHAEVYFFGRVAISTNDLDIQKLHYVRPFRKF